eukprot:6456043-Amphidinium_carterae.2
MRLGTIKNPQSEALSTLHVTLRKQANCMSDGNLSPKNVAGSPRPLEPRALEPTPTQTKQLGMGLSLRQAGFSKGQQEVVACRRLSWQVQGRSESRLDLQCKEKTCEGLSVQVAKFKVCAKLSVRQVLSTASRKG